MTSQPEVIILPDAAAIHHAAAGRFVHLAAQRVAEHGSFLLALAGGSTPRGLYQRLAQEPLRSQVPWEHMHVIWGDERYIPHNDPDSNYAMVRAALLDYVPIPPEQVYPMHTHFDDPHQAAAVYNETIRALFEAHQNQIDMLLLGMGGDGHVASLFPQHPTLYTPDDNRYVIAVEQAPKPPPVRLSLTFAALNRASYVLFLVTGADKATALHRVLHGPQQPDDLPAQRVRPEQGVVTWLVDEAATPQADT
jgi:6-phosphogluconolactonase